MKNAELNIKTFVVNQLQENCYVVSDDTRQAVVIDCGAYYDSERTAIVNYIRENNLTLIHNLCTHGHFDHVFGADTIFKEFALAPEVHSADRMLVEDLESQYRDMLGMAYGRETVAVSHCLAEGETVKFGNHELKVIHTPGHSPGSVVFLCEAENVAFTGDTIFRMSVGRTDLPGGSWMQLTNSLHKLATMLADNTRLLPGHGPTTILDEEKRYNPYFD